MKSYDPVKYKAVFIEPIYQQFIDNIQGVSQSLESTAPKYNLADCTVTLLQGLHCVRVQSNAD